LIFDKLVFESERLIGKPLELSDAEDLFAIYSDKEAMKFRGSPPLESIDDAREMISKQLSSKGSVTRFRLAVRLKSSNQLIGSLLLIYDSQEPSRCELGFSFGKDFWNRGYGRETLGMIENALKGHELVQELIAWSIKDNLASGKIFRGSGYRVIPQRDYP
jgi:RimJ/RimL family protein N-acetyltransferase